LQYIPHGPKGPEKKTPNSSCSGQANLEKKEREDMGLKTKREKRKDKSPIRHRVYTPACPNLIDSMDTMREKT
jgi:hypothetical protein